MIWQTVFSTFVLIPLIALTPVKRRHEEDLRVVTLPVEYLCIVDLPNALGFREALANNMTSSKVSIFSGGDSLVRRSFPPYSLSADTIKNFATHHGYNLIFLDELDYDKSLEFKGIKFSPHWHRVFAMESMRAQFPDSKYFVWFDDDILAVWPETDMLNHYINLMENDDEWKIMYVRERDPIILNSGLIIFKNTDFAFDAFYELIHIGMQNNGRLANIFGHEQEAMAKYRAENGLERQIRLVSNREQPYSLNTFYRSNPPDLPGARYQFGDAFVHFLGGSDGSRIVDMNQVMYEANRWRDVRPSFCTYPVVFRTSTSPQQVSPVDGKPTRFVFQFS